MAGPRIAVYAGSFDPITVGHMDLVRRASTLFDHVVLAIGIHPGKQYLLDLETRQGVLDACISDLSNVTVETFEGLLVDHCKDVGAAVIIRGLRAVTDFEFEFQTGLANMDMAPDIETVFLLSEPRNIFISSSLVKEIATNGGDVSRYVPAEALEALNRVLN